MKRVALEKKFITALLLGTAFLAGCGDDDNFTPVAKDRGYDYAFTTTKEFADYPCNEMRVGREAVVGREKESYYCELFDETDSVYIWAGYNDTLTATGKEFVRAGSSSSSREEYFDPDADYGTMKDPRDGRTYKTVVVNGQLWMAENLNYADNNVGTAVCYSNNLNNCDQYGRLYSRDAAMDDSRCEYLSDCDLGDGPIQGICPDGWHIPTVEEMENLVAFVGDNVSRYKSTGSTWNYDGGVDTYGLSFLGAGNWSSSNGFEDLHRYEVTWAYYPNTYQHYLLLGGPSDLVTVGDYNGSEYYSSVRCVKGSMRQVSSSSSYSSSSYRSSSSYSSSYSSSSSYTWIDPFDPDIDYGTMKDSRDGKTYKTVVVNGQTWMAENLNYADNNVGTAVCYSNNLNNCDQYGRLYSRDAAMDDSRCEYQSGCDLGDDPIQGICPDGWHIPTVDDMNNLVDFVGNNVSRYKSTASTWNYDDGVDTYGLSFLGAGNWSSSNGFEDLHRYEVTWAYYPDTYQHYLLLGGPSGIISVVSYKDSEYYSSVRCVKGEMIPASSSSSYSSSSSARSSSSSYSGPWSSENPSSSFSIDSKEDLFNPELTYGTMTDPRDNKTYKTIEFNGQIWMAENLNFSDSSIAPLLEGHNTCYHEKESECELFGRLYDRVAAMNDSRCEYDAGCALGSDPIQGICPDGWHVLSYDEAESMISYVGSNYAEKIISAKGWGSSVNGDNTYGLSFIAPGTRDGGNYDSKGGYAFYWVYKPNYNQNYLLIDGKDATLELSTYNSHVLSLPVRCIKDE